MTDGVKTATHTKERLIEQLKKSFGRHMDLKEIKANTFQLFLPYYHMDGDMLDLFIEVYEGEKFIVKDFGQTMMRLSYDTDIDSETRKAIFDKILASYNVEFDNKKGQFFILVENAEELFTSISEFITVILRVSDISYLREERMRNMFYKIFDMFVDEKLTNLNMQKGFQFSFDLKGDYKAPYLFFSEKKTPIILVPVLNSEKCTEYISSYRFYTSHNEKVRTIASFYDVEEISNKVRGKFLDIIDKPFSNFGSNKESLINYTNEIKSIF